MTFIAAVNTRIESLKNSPPELRPERPEEDLRAGYLRSYNNLHVRLTALRIMPAYFIPPATTHDLRRPVDVSGVIEQIRFATRNFEGHVATGLHPETRFDAELEKNNPPHICFEILKAHMSSCTRGGEGFGGPPVFSSLSGIMAAMQLYFGAVVGMINVDWKPIRALIPYTVSVLVRDLRDGTGDMEGWDNDRLDLWLWKAVAGWVGLAVIQGHEEAMQSPFCWWIRQWSEHTCIRDWKGAREALDRVVWPRTVARGLDMDGLWQDILMVDCEKS